MSDRRLEPSDWSEQSEALFQSARGDHAPTALDRARVRSALAQRLAAASNVAPVGGSLPAAGTQQHAGGVALGKLVKFGVGVACVLAGTFAVMRNHETKKPAARAPTAMQPTAASAKPSEPTPAPTVSTQALATPLHDQPAVAVLAHPDGAPTARVVTKRSRARSTPPKLSTSTRVPARAEPQPSAAQVALAEPQALAIDKTAAASTSAVAQDPVSAQEPAQRAATQPTPAGLPAGDSRSASVADSRSASVADSRSASVAAAAEQADSADERAELAFVARIHAALRESKLRSVLALCTEHERRWPHGAFVQEREALRAIASCGSSVIGADARARTFLASYPRAPLAPRVHDACVQQLKAAVEKRSAAAPAKPGDK